MFQIGQFVKTLDPFKESFPDTYEIEDIIEHPDGQTTYLLREIGGFDPQYLELVQ